MKNLFLNVLVTISTITLLVSCSNNKNENSLIGSWELNQWNLEKALDLNGDGKVNQDLLKEFGCLKGSKLEFKSDNTVTLSFSSDVKFYIEPTENLVVEKAPIMMICGTNTEKLPSPFSYSINGNIITLKNDTESLELVLNKNTLSMKIHNGFKAFNSSTDETIFSQDGTYLFTKK